MSEQIPPEEQERIAREVAEQLRKLRVEDVLIQSLITISSIGYQRLGTTEDTRDLRDLEQTRLAIETMRAVTPILGQFVPAELIRDFDQSVANLQLAYASAAAEDAAADDAEPGLTAPRPGGIVIRMPAVATWLETEHCALSGEPGRSTL